MPKWRSTSGVATWSGAMSENSGARWPPPAAPGRGRRHRHRPGWRRDRAGSPPARDDPGDLRRGRQPGAVGRALLGGDLADVALPDQQLVARQVALVGSARRRDRQADDEDGDPEAEGDSGHAPRRAWWRTRSRTRGRGERQPSGEHGREAPHGAANTTPTISVTTPPTRSGPLTCWPLGAASTTAASPPAPAGRPR